MTGLRAAHVKLSPASPRDVVGGWARAAEGEHPQCGQGGRPVSAWGRAAARATQLPLGVNSA